MSAKLRVQVGETVISWGITPESVTRDRTERELPRYRFAVIQGGIQSTAIVQDDQPVRAQSA